MVYNEQLAGKIHTILARRRGFSEKKMFGGMAFMLDGSMCCGALKDDLVVRVGSERYEEALALPHARPMDFTGRKMKGFVYINSKGWSDDAALKKWVDMGVSYASSLPKKK
jgi:TfoX/Sxy family transcriptional regulator of competence genes